MTRTVVAVFGACAIAARALGSLSLRKVQFFACWADVDITLCIVLELLRAKEFRAMIVIRKGNVGTEVLAFDGHDILLGAVLLIARGLPGPQFPPEARSPQ